MLIILINLEFDLEFRFMFATKWQGGSSMRPPIEGLEDVVAAET